MLRINYKFLLYIVLFNICLSLVINAKNATRKDPCADYPSCKLISEQMFESYCKRSTLKNMCPSHCDKKCKNTTETGTNNLVINSEEEEEFLENFDDSTSTTTIAPTTTSTTTKKSSKGNKKKPSKNTKTTTKSKADVLEEASSTEMIQTKYSKNKKTTTTSTTVSTTTITTKSSKLKQINANEPEEKTSSKEIDYEEEENKDEVTTTTTVPTTKLNRKSTKKLSLLTSTSKKLLQTEKDNSETTKTVANLPNATIYVPLYEAGFVQRIIPTSNKPDCDFTKAIVCKKDNCVKNAVWCPNTNDVPKEQIEILFNYTTDIYMFETQGKMDTNETVTNFLFQYLNEAGILVSHMYKTETKNSTAINKFMFDPPLRTNYIRITPIDFVQSIAMRFEVYSKGVLYNPEKH